MELLNLDLKNIVYIQSEAEFSRAKTKGFWEVMGSLVTGHRPHLLSFDEFAHNLQPQQIVYAGLQDIPTKAIIGSAGRYRDFTRHFFPSLSDERGKERWRTIYTLAVSGAGFPPIEVYQIETVYFVQNGHHRVSVATYLGWTSIQAHVTVLPSLPGEAVDFADQPYGRKGVN
ncbi:MAG TPA: hypothetical protein VEC93_23025 [Anaerolineae bacterium]|nr:hypothetical protein [Anaerolineae bacterium]